MMNRRRALMALFATTALPSIAKAETFLPVSLDGRSDADTLLAQGVAAVETALEEARKKHNVPGAALVIVKDDKIVFMRGFGARSVGNAAPVTADTLFGIGSATKSFTAMAAMISADDRKLSLADHPRKFLPYFTLSDPEANEKITMRDLLIHSSGLMRTDLPWMSGALTREEAIRVAGKARPVAKFRSAWNYQNVMYIAAGEAIGQAQNASFEQVVAERIFAPLGMTRSATTLEAMRKMSDVADGYQLKKGQPRRVRDADHGNVGAAGAIGSSARDMAQWLRVMLGAGEVDGRRLVSRESFAEIVKPQIATGDGAHYGLGWDLYRRDGIDVIEHGGVFDGYQSQMFMVPEHKLGFVMLSNVQLSPLPNDVTKAFWRNLVVAAKPEAEEPAVAAELEAGHYIMGGVAADVAMKDGGLILTLPGDGDIPLVHVKGRRYAFGGGSPDGFFVTFRSSEGRPDETEMLLEQPQGNVVLFRQGPNDVANYAGPYGELIARYSLGDAEIEITAAGARLALLIPAQSAYRLAELKADTLFIVELGETYRLEVARNGSGAATGVVFKEPGGNFEATMIGAPTSPSVGITADDLLARMIAAAGGAAALAKPRTMQTVEFVTHPNQGLTGEIVTRISAQRMETEARLFGLDKTVLRLTRLVEDGKVTAWSDIDGMEPDYDAEPFRFEFREQLDKAKFKSISINGSTKIENEPVYVVVKQPHNGGSITDYVSTGSFLVLRRVQQSAGAQMTLDYSDHKAVDGIVLPMRTSTKTMLSGDIVMEMKRVTFDSDAGGDVAAALAA